MYILIYALYCVLANFIKKEMDYELKIILLDIMTKKDGINYHRFQEIVQKLPRIIQRKKFKSSDYNTEFLDLLYAPFEEAIFQKKVSFLREMEQLDLFSSFLLILQRHFLTSFLKFANFLILMSKLIDPNQQNGIFHS